mmetsp:Transcript_12767/g.18136  ORF Transcript_12767/g.18136 Transcript_12767/m.18136 type:complete len:204 (-) Transcript_12767:114-725(-)
MSRLAPPVVPGAAMVKSTGLRNMDSASERTVGVTVAEKRARVAVVGNALNIASICRRNDCVCDDPDEGTPPPFARSCSICFSPFLLGFFWSISSSAEEESLSLSLSPSLCCPFFTSCFPLDVIPSLASRRRSASSKIIIRSAVKSRPFSRESTSRSGVVTNTSKPCLPPAFPATILAAFDFDNNADVNPPGLPIPSRSTSRCN